jgi:RimJ/RimL family protein N-acetyltransferase
LIISRTDDRLLGSTGLRFQAPHEAVTGYVLAKDAWGKGYATEALAAVIDVAARIGVTRLFALCHPDHRPSRRVLEKCGFMRDETSTRQVEFPNLATGIQQEQAATLWRSKRERITRANSACSGRRGRSSAPPLMPNVSRN